MSHKVYHMAVNDVYPHYVAKAEKNGKTQCEVDELICWLTGHDEASLHEALDSGQTFEAFFDQAPALNPHRKLITGVICGVRVEEIDEPLMQEIRYLDKIIDELARGKKIDSIKRTPKDD